VRAGNSSCLQFQREGVYMLQKNKIYLGDCLEVMKDIADKSVDLICTDPPYNIKKADWDSWKTKEFYVEWCGQWMLECQRVLKDNGSFYFFHNNMVQIAMLMEWIRRNTKFIFKQFIVWNKKFSGAKNEGFLRGFNEVNMLRNYQQMAEYCLFYTFQDETGLTTVMLDTNNFSTLRQYFREYQEALGLSIGEINKILGHRKAEHAFYWKSTQWDLPTKETYLEIGKLPLKYEFVRREYEDLRREYEDLRREYENLRYTFNNQKTHHSVWNYDIAKKKGHITPKPVDLIENILLHSSNENDLILDPFIGSGTTAVACINTGRNFIGIEKEEKYYDIANKRIKDTLEHHTTEIDTPLKRRIIANVVRHIGH
jgi:site-specific DNA-methyltransferase (adenine-specific)